MKKNRMGGKICEERSKVDKNYEHEEGIQNIQSFSLIILNKKCPYKRSYNAFRRGHVGFVHSITLRQT